MKAMSILLLVFGVIGSCSGQVCPRTATTATITAADILQTAGAQMTAFLNLQENTISMLYGDSAAVEITQSSFKHHTAEEHFVLFTYQLKDFNYDYDAQAGGAVERVEYIAGLDLKDTGKFSYRITVGKRALDSKGVRFNDSDRVKFIFPHDPYQYPSVVDINR